MDFLSPRGLVCQEAHTNCQVACPSGLNPDPAQGCLRSSLFQVSLVHSRSSLLLLSPRVCMVLPTCSTLLVVPVALGDEVLSARGFTLLAILACLKCVATDALNCTEPPGPFKGRGEWQWRALRWCVPCWFGCRYCSSCTEMASAGVIIPAPTGWTPGRHTHACLLSPSGPLT